MEMQEHTGSTFLQEIWTKPGSLLACGIHENSKITKILRFGIVVQLKEEE